ncbi:MAG: heparin lyase I family protein [Opitutae bacterium]|nr:heparin lyase I family protein [Opitutae bacterium]
MKILTPQAIRRLIAGILVLGLALLPLSAVAAVYYTIDLEAVAAFSTYGPKSSSGLVSGTFTDAGVTYRYQLQGAGTAAQGVHGILPSLSGDARAGDASLLLQVPRLTSSGGGQPPVSPDANGRSQVYSDTATFDHGDDRYTAFSVKIDPATFADPTDFLLFVQWHQQANASGGGNSPCVELRIKHNVPHPANAWLAEIITRNTGGNIHEPTFELPKNAWVAFVVHTRFVELTADGTVEVWMKRAGESWDTDDDGAWSASERRVVNVTNRKIGYWSSTQADRLAKVKYAVYRGPNGGQWDREHRVLFDEIRFGATRDEVASNITRLTFTRP